jgi:hypothetical protein
VNGYASRAYLDIETAYYSPYYSYSYYYPGYDYYEPYGYAFGFPDEGFAFGFVGHRLGHEFAEHHEFGGRHRFFEPREFAEHHEFEEHNGLGGRAFGHAMAPEVGRAQFARSFAAYRVGSPAAHFRGGHGGGAMRLGRAMPGAFGAHMAAIGHVGAARIEDGYLGGGRR